MAQGGNEVYNHFEPEGERKNKLRGFISLLLFMCVLAGGFVGIFVVIGLIRAMF